MGGGWLKKDADAVGLEGCPGRGASLEKGREETWAGEGWKFSECFGSLGFLRLLLFLAAVLEACGWTAFLLSAFPLVRVRLPGCRQRGGWPEGISRTLSPMPVPDATSPEGLFSFSLPRGVFPLLLSLSLLSRGYVRGWGVKMVKDTQVLGPRRQAWTGTEDRPQPLRAGVASSAHHAPRQIPPGHRAARYPSENLPQHRCDGSYVEGASARELVF